MTKYSAKGERHLKILCSMPCMFCRIDPGNVAHHIRVGTLAGMGRKNKDDCAVPICHTCHTTLHTKGERRFYERHGHTPEDLLKYAKQLWDQNNAKQRARRSF